MRKLSIAICWMTVFCLFVASNGNAQNDKLMDNTLYKNVVKYYDQATAFHQQGNAKDAKKRLQYADQFAQKLVKAGYKAEMQDYLKKIQQLQGQLSPTGVATKINNNNQAKTAAASGPQMDRNEWRTAVNEITQFEGQLRNLFNFLPAYANLNENYTSTVEKLQEGNLPQRIEYLKKQAQAQQAYHKSYVKNLDRVLSNVNDLEAVLAASSFSNNMESTFQYIETGAKGQADFVVKNTSTYLDLLSKVLKQNSLITQMREKLNQAEISLQEKEKAEATAAQKGTAKDRSLPVRGLSNATLEKEFKSLARSSVPSQFQIVDVIITSSSWGINKDALGRPLNRAMIAYMVEKDKSGKCYVQYFAFSQPAVGGSYGRTRIDLDWSSKSRREVDCP